MRKVPPVRAQARLRREGDNVSAEETRRMGGQESGGMCISVLAFEVEALLVLATACSLPCMQSLDATQDGGLNFS